MYIELSRSELIELIAKQLSQDDKRHLCELTNLVIPGLKLNILHTDNGVRFVGQCHGEVEESYMKLTISTEQVEIGTKNITKLRQKLSEVRR